MKTILPTRINSIKEAKALLTQLHLNSEAFHPEDDATDLVAPIFTVEEGAKLNSLMEDIYLLHGFDPCEFLLYIQNLTAVEEYKGLVIQTYHLEGAVYPTSHILRDGVLQGCTVSDYVASSIEKAKKRIDNGKLKGI